MELYENYSFISISFVGEYLLIRYLSPCCRNMEQNWTQVQARSQFAYLLSTFCRCKPTLERKTHTTGMGRIQKDEEI